MSWLERVSKMSCLESVAKLKNKTKPQKRKRTGHLTATVEGLALPLLALITASVGISNKQMSCPAKAQLLSNTLYYKRFFPYYAFDVLGGLDNEGKGCVFTYDAVGSYERVGYSSQGSGSTLIIPVLDNQLKSPSPLLLPAKDAVTPLSESEAVDLVKDVFASAAERDIYTEIV
ncbi:hypothetical protein AAC387_Pa01g3262 [Persea americana]